MLTLSGALVYMARMIGAMSTGSKHARKEGDKFAGQRVVMDDALGGSIVTAVIRDASGETGLMQHIIGEEEEDIRVTGNAMLGPCISGGPGGRFLAVCNHRGVHVFENVAGPDGPTDAVLICHHLTTNPVRLISISGSSLVFVENDTTLVVLVIHANDFMSPVRKEIVVDSSIVTADYANGSAWILCTDGTVVLDNGQNTIRPTSIDGSITPLGIIAMADGLRACVVGALRDKRLVFTNCRINLSDKGGRVYAEQGTVDLQYTWNGDPIAINSGAFALMCRDAKDEVCMVLSTRHGQDCMTGRLRFMYMDDMALLMKEPVTSLRCHNIYYTEQLVSVTLSANNRLFSIASVVKTPSTKSDFMNATMMIRYCIHVSDGVSEVLSVLLSEGAGPMAIEDSSKGLGKSMIDSGVCDNIMTRLKKRADLAAAIARARTKSEDGSSFTIGKVSQLQARTDILNAKLEAELEARKAQEVKNAELQQLVSDAAKRQKQMAKTIAKFDEQAKKAEAATAKLKKELREMRSVQRGNAEIDEVVKAAVAKAESELQSVCDRKHNEQIATLKRQHAAQLEDAKRKAEAKAAKAKEVTKKEMAREVSKLRKTYKDMERRLQEQYDAKQKALLTREVAVGEKKDETTRMLEKERAAVERALEEKRLLRVTLEQEREAAMQALVAEKARADAACEKAAESKHSADAEEITVLTQKLKAAESRIADAQAQIAASERGIQGLQCENAQLRQSNSTLSHNNAFWQQFAATGMMPDGTPATVAMEQLPNLHVFKAQIDDLTLKMQELVRERTGTATDMPLAHKELEKAA